MRMGEREEEIWGTFKGRGREGSGNKMEWDPAEGCILG